MGLLDSRHMIDKMKAITADSEFISNIDTLTRVYDYLSTEYVHFGTKAIPDEEPVPVPLGKNKETRRDSILSKDIKSTY